jgi:glutathione S-transferase
MSDDAGNDPRMVLHGGPISPFVRKAGICVIEKGLEESVRCQRSPAAMAKANLDLLTYNPLIKIPTLVMERRVLFDSDVICEYLDAITPPSTLFPAAGDARWSALRWNALGSGALDALVLWRFERNRPAAHQSQDVLDVYRIKIQAVLALVEREIASLEPAGYGIGHIATGCLFGYLDFRFADLDWRAACPRSAAWYRDSFLSRPSSRRTVPYEGERPAGDHLWPSS